MSEAEGDGLPLAGPLTGGDSGTPHVRNEKEAPPAVTPTAAAGEPEAPGAAGSSRPTKHENREKALATPPPPLAPVLPLDEEEEDEEAAASPAAARVPVG